VILKRIVHIFGNDPETKAPASTPPDPASEFNDPGNHSLFARFEKDSRVAAPPKDQARPSRYEARAHSDLIPILYELISDHEIKKGSAYGRPLMANSRGFVFAYAEGSNSIFLKLREEKHDASRQDGGRYDPSYGQDWIEFRVGGRIEGPADWRDAMQRWARISYQDSLILK
jgi:hypothetical protein